MDDDGDINNKHKSLLEYRAALAAKMMEFERAFDLSDPKRSEREDDMPHESLQEIALMILLNGGQEGYGKITVSHIFLTVL